MQNTTSHEPEPPPAKKPKAIAYWQDRDELQRRMIELSPRSEQQRIRNLLPTTGWSFPDDFEERLKRAEEKTTELYTDLKFLISQLRHFVPLFLGFYCLVETQTEWCTCPCWDRLFMEHVGMMGPSSRMMLCKFRPRKQPRSLLDHLKQVGSSPDNRNATLASRVHGAIYQYLKVFFENHCGSLLHQAFYPGQSEPDRLVRTAQNRRVMRGVLIGRRVVKEKEREIAENQKKKQNLDKMLSMMEKTNPERVREYECTMQLTQKLHAKLKKALHLDETKLRKNPTKRERQLYQLGFSGSVQLLKAGMEDSIRERSKLQIENLDTDFDLNSCFDRWYKDSLYFFDRSGEGPESLLTGLAVNFRDENIRIANEQSRNDMAVDEGGPTRQFLSMVWKALPELAVDGSKLFDDDKKGPLPFPVIANVNQTKVTAYYNAVGQLFSFCLLNGMHISDHVLPKICKVFLLKDIRPTDRARYPIEELVRDVYQKMAGGAELDKIVDSMVEMHVAASPEDRCAKIQDLCKKVLLYLSDEMERDIASTINEISDYEKVCGANHSLEEKKRLLEPLYQGLQQRCIIEKMLMGAGESEGADDQERQFRENVKDTYITAPIDEIKKGMRLNGLLENRSISDLFDLIPINGIGLAFASPDFEVEDVVESLTLSPCYDRDEDMPLQQQVYAINEEGMRCGALVDAVRNLGMEDSGKDFLRQFVMFVSGYTFLPSNSSFTIGVEFSNELAESSLPVAHSCICLLKLPVTAYGGDVGRLTSSLQKSLEWTTRTTKEGSGISGLFNMQ